MTLIRAGLKLVVEKVEGAISGEQWLGPRCVESCVWRDRFVISRKLDETGGLEDPSGSAACDQERLSCDYLHDSGSDLIGQRDFVD